MTVYVTHALTEDYHLTSQLRSVFSIFKLVFQAQKAAFLELMETKNRAKRIVNIGLPFIGCPVRRLQMNENLALCLLDI